MEISNSEINDCVDKMRVAERQRRQKELAKLEIETDTEYRRIVLIASRHIKDLTPSFEIETHVFYKSGDKLNHLLKRLEEKFKPYYSIDYWIYPDLMVKYRFKVVV